MQPQGCVHPISYPDNAEVFHGFSLQISATGSHLVFLSLGCLAIIAYMTSLYSAPALSINLLPRVYTKYLGVYTGITSVDSWCVWCSSSMLATFSSLDSLWSIIFSLTCGILVLLVFFTRWYVQKATRRVSVINSSHSTTSVRCTSASCVRCHGEMDVKSKMLQRLEKYVAELHGTQDGNTADSISKNYPRVLSTLQSHEHKTELLKGIFQESGFAATRTPTANFPHVWMMPGLRRKPLWTSEDHIVIRQLFTAIETTKNYRKIVRDFGVISRSNEGWKTNVISTGEWRTFYLINQGQHLQENVVKCPQTVQILETTTSLMIGSSFGNAMFSVLQPGSRIEPHTSPCNFRLRCHLALDASSGFFIRVGARTVTWTTGKLLVFDDSFVHIVRHEEQEGRQRETRERIVLIFDIWHPDITTEEQAALNSVFS